MTAVWVSLGAVWLALSALALSQHIQPAGILCALAALAFMLTALFSTLS